MLNILYVGCTTFLKELIFIHFIKKLHVSVITDTLLLTPYPEPN